MNQRIISIFTLLTFIVFTFSCSIYTTSTKNVNTAADWKGKKGKILGVVKTSGEYIEFSKDDPGRINGDKITGIAIIMSKEMEIEQANLIQIVRNPRGNIVTIKDKEGKAYNVVGTAREEEDKIIFLATYTSSESVSISLSEVKSLRIKKLNIGSVAMLGVLACVSIGFLALGIAIRD